MPLITRPTRLTNSTATLIDNIFTNDFIDIEQSMTGLFITDISDHLPIFYINEMYESTKKRKYHLSTIFFSKT